MLKSILKIDGSQKLNNLQLKNIKGGHAWTCTRTKNGVTGQFNSNQSEATATAWVNAWSSLGWNTTCTHNAHQ